MTKKYGRQLTRKHLCHTQGVEYYLLIILCERVQGCFNPQDGMYSSISGLEINHDKKQILMACEIMSQRTAGSRGEINGSL